MISPNFSSEWQYLSGTEAVTLFRKLTDGTYDTGTPIPNALRLLQTKTISEATRGISTKSMLSWYLWASQTAAPPVKRDDVIQDSGGLKWLVKDIDVEAFGARYLCKTVQER